MTTRDIDRPSSPRWWQPTAAALVVLALVTGAVAWPRLTADADTAPAMASQHAVTVITPAAPINPRTCEVSQPLTVAQLAALAHQPAPPPVTLAAPVPARPHLRPMIRDLRAAACDTQKGRYAHTQTRQWATNISSSGGTTTLDLQVWQYQRWRAPDNSGRAITITQPAEGQAPTDEIYQPGQAPVEALRLATDPRLLAEQLGHSQPVEEGPQYLLRAWAEINAWYSPDRAQRAAALTLFRDTDGIDFHATARDRAGRTGIALSVTSDNGIGRDLLILDPRTGELLAFEMAAMRDPGRLGITEPTVLDYHLFLAHTHTAATGKP
jgi:hypothetical protein